MRQLLLVDLEATCWEGRAHVPENMETIEIGALLVDPHEPEHPREFQTFVRPVRFPVLSAFCTRLTTIRQEDVAIASPFPAALERFLAWIGAPGEARFASWGDYDRKQIARDCDFHALPYPFAADHLNLKRHLGPLLGLRRSSMAEALGRAGLELEGVHHRALDDARNVWRILRKVDPALLAGPQLG